MNKISYQTGNLATVPKCLDIVLMKEGKNWYLYDIFSTEETWTRNICLLTEISLCRINIEMKRAYGNFTGCGTCHIMLLVHFNWSRLNIT